MRFRDSSEVRGNVCCRGVTAFELLLTLGLIAILFALAAPSFTRGARNSRVLATAHELLHGLHFARSQAMLANRPATLCLSNDGARCTTDRRAAARGWIVFLVDSMPQSTTRAATPVLREFQADDLAFFGSRSAVTFWPVSRAGTTDTLVVCDPQHLAAGRAIIVSQTGRPRMAAADDSRARSTCRG
ncbi:MAG: GspH/FimT family pseudopilin [Steroidobacteraceae bacterium]